MMFLMGALAGYFAFRPGLVGQHARLFLTTGILGGFTTFSAFGLETFNLANDGQLRLALANVVLSCGLGFVAVWGGYRLAERWFGV